MGSVRKINININVLIIIFFGSYLALFLYMVLTAPHLALVESFYGADASTLEISREEFLKTRTGYEAFLPYLNAFMTAAIIPYLIAVLYIAKHKYRHLVLGIFIITLMITLEKALVIKALLPLMVLAANQNIKIDIKKNLGKICTLFQ